ncbi:aldehyde dehydrogenase family protein [Bosea sp. 117]|uniref:aldehyde dehydrogenase family protein n=1 Tax=Bosea sp. 117 TaxID=1125973 RepID=UPI0004942C92|nr:aldehyde dehydrogenase family protein [Bosea sp. 117]
MVRTYYHWIDGSQTEAAGDLIDRNGPADGRLLARYAAGTAADVDRAVATARAAFESGVWSNMPASERAGVLNAWADLLAKDVERLAVIEAEEVGKPILQARGEVNWSIELLRYAAALAWQLSGQAFTHLGPEKLGLVTREPRGVIGMIVPWNFPIVTLFQKLPFALAAGCAAVVKPSELTSGTALETAKLASAAGVPDGIINIVTGTGPVVGEALATHAGVDMLSFTGSTAVGKRIARNAADGIKRVALELGGKSANIVFADADLDKAIEGVITGFILNQGEECCAGSRLLVEESIAESFTARLVERLKSVRLGLPLDEASDIGALIHEGHLERVLGFIETGRKEGAVCVAGGARATAGGLDKGFFVEPTIFAGVTPDMTIYRQEIFGPVLSVIPFRTVDEAVSIANDTHYGLANGLWTSNVDKALGVSRRLRSGTVYVNTYLETAPQMPFGGFKESGYGRENGLDGLHEYTEVKSTFMRLAV